MRFIIIIGSVLFMSVMMPRDMQAQFTMPDFAAMERNNIAMSEAQAPSLILKSDDGQTAIMKIIILMYNPSYYYIQVNDSGVKREYRFVCTRANEKKLRNGRNTLTLADHVYLDTPYGDYVFQIVNVVGGVGGMMPYNTSGQSNPSSQGSAYKPTCQSCHGTGICGSCNGSGVIRGYESTSPCPNCSASNGRKCNVCGGSGHW